MKAENNAKKVSLSLFIMMIISVVGIVTIAFQKLISTGEILWLQFGIAFVLMSSVVSTTDIIKFQTKKTKIIASTVFVVLGLIFIITDVSLAVAIKLNI